MKRVTLTMAVLIVIQSLSGQGIILNSSFYSEALQETKMVDVYLPPGYDVNPDLYYPVIYLLHAWGGNQNSGNTYMNTANDLINAGTMDPVIMVCADNSPGPFGGSMYVNSTLWGDYEDYMVNDLPNWVESTYRAMPEKNYRGLFGQSMGGYGVFRYGILYKEQYRAITSHAGLINFSDEYAFENGIQEIKDEWGGQAPYEYHFGAGDYTNGQFLMSGAFAPRPEPNTTPQTYVFPNTIEFFMDSLGNPIDTIVEKCYPHNIAHLISQLTAGDSLGIYFGVGSADEWFLYPGTLAVKDSMDLYGIPYGFYEHAGGHAMPAQFRLNALAFLDSLLYPPAALSSCLPEGITFTTQEEIDNFQSNYPGCTEIEGGVWIQGDDISNLDGLSPITEVGGILSIGGTGATNPSLQSIEGLQNLVSVGSHLNIGTGSGNPCHPLLTSLGGLENLISVGGNIVLAGNTALQDLNGFVNLASLDGHLVIKNNDALMSLEGLEGLSAIGGNLEICTNPSLESLEGLENVTTIEGSLFIGNAATEAPGNATLMTLDGLQALNSIGGNLSIFENDALASLSGLDNIEGSSILSLYISSNGALSDCAVQSICDYLVAPFGIPQIQDNAPGCDSQEEVEEACESVGTEEQHIQPFTIHPNPTGNGSVTITLNNPHNLHLTCFNPFGQQVHRQEITGAETVIDVSTLAPGIYLAVVSEDGKPVGRSKFVVQ
jgi:S-formylglutathione hydrolase FrmB